MCTPYQFPLEDIKHILEMVFLHLEKIQRSSDLKSVKIVWILTFWTKLSLEASKSNSVKILLNAASKGEKMHLITKVFSTKPIFSRSTQIWRSIQNIAPYNLILMILKGTSLLHFAKNWQVWTKIWSDLSLIKIDSIYMLRHSYTQIFFLKNYILLFLNRIQLRYF